MDYTPAKLYDAKGDLKARWYVYFRIRGADGKLTLRKKKAGINREKTVRGRRRVGALLVASINELLAKGWRDKAGDSPEIPLIDRCNEILSVKKQSLRRRTWQSYKYSLDVLYTWMRDSDLQYLTPKEFTQSHALAFADHIQRSRFTGKTFNDCKGNISVFFNAMVDRGLIEKNPFSKVKSLREEAGKNLAFTDKQRRDIGKRMKAQNPRLRLFTQWVYFCFIRPAELLRIKVENVDLKSRTVTIYGSQSKNKKTETVVIPDKFMPLVKAMKLNKYPAHFYLFGRGLNTCADSLGRNAVSMMHSEIMRDMGMPSRVSLYSWKHTGNISAYKKGIDLFSLMRQNRHSSLLQTQIYLKSLGLVPNIEFARKMA